MKLSEFMTTHIHFVDADCPVYDAIEKMVDRRIRSLVVSFGGNPPEYGVITARDVVAKVLGKGADPAALKVSEIASRPLFCVEKDMEMFEAARVMEEHRVARVFVCDNGRIIGVVAMIDMMSAALIMRAKGE
ncbi:MAG: CBS domain-containing protein [Desulfobacterales bacterium]